MPPTDLMRSFNMLHAPRIVLLTLTLLAPTLGGASPLGERFPVGSIASRVEAQAALDAAAVEQARIDQEHAARLADCHRRFFANRCLEALRQDKEMAERELRRVRLEARDLQRRLDAEDLARRREEQPPPAVPEPRAPAQARPPSTPRPATRQATPHDSTRSAAEEAESRAARAEAQAQHRQRISDAEQRAAQDADNIREFNQKQADAAARAKAKEAERLRNEARRAERRKKLEAVEAQREEIRKRAEAAVNAK